MLYGSWKMMRHKEIRFPFEELKVWQRAVDFANAVIQLLEKIDTERRHFRMIEQLEAAATSIAMNIAEGKGRYSRKEFTQFLYIARGSLYETVTLLTIFRKNQWIKAEEFENIKNFADEIGKMLASLIASIRRAI